MAEAVNELNETKEYFFVSSDCPITPGAEEVEVYFDVNKERLFFYCRGCGCTWLENPDTSWDPDFYRLEDVTSDELRLPTLNELKALGISNPKTVYEKIDAAIGAKIKISKL